MEIISDAIIISVRKFSENSNIITCFSQEAGIISGIYKGAHSKKRRGIIQPGNQVHLRWRARLEQQLGTVELELTQAVAARVMPYADKLAALTCCCALLKATLPERHPYIALYRMTLKLLDVLCSSSYWLTEYIHFELELLSSTGFRLDLRCCAATGTKENLCYVSPKSGRAVSQVAGAPYKSKLLPLPSFLVASTPCCSCDEKDYIDALYLTGFFLEKWLLAPQKIVLPRQRLMLVAHKEISTF